MSLKNIRKQERQVQLSDGESIAVRGLSLSDITEIVYVNEAALTEVFGAVMQAVKDGGASLANPAALILELARKFPLIAAYVIAAATGDADATEEAEALPFGKQVEILKSCIEQTLTTSAEAGNLFGIVIDMIAKSTDGAAAALASQKPPSP